MVNDFGILMLIIIFLVGSLVFLGVFLGIKILEDCYDMKIYSIKEFFEDLFK